MELKMTTKQTIIYLLGIIFMLFLSSYTYAFTSCLNVTPSTTASDYLAYDKFDRADNNSLGVNANNIGYDVSVNAAGDAAISGNTLKIKTPTAGNTWVRSNFTNLPYTNTVTMEFDLMLGNTNVFQGTQSDLATGSLTTNGDGCSYLYYLTSQTSGHLQHYDGAAWRTVISSANVSKWYHISMQQYNNNSICFWTDTILQGCWSCRTNVNSTSLTWFGQTDGIGGNSYIDNLTVYNGTDCPTSVSDTTPPVISNVNFTSCGGDTTEPYNDNCGDITPTYTFDTNEAATCKISTWNATKAFDNFSLLCTTTGSTSHTCTINSTLAISEGNSTIYAACNDSSGNNNTILGDSNAFFTILFIDNPNVTLYNPINNNYSTLPVDSSRSITFNASATDGGTLKSLQLWGNWSGSWSANESNLTAISNNTPFTFTSISLGEGNYLWNVYACDAAQNCAFGSINYTFINNVSYVLNDIPISFCTNISQFIVIPNNSTSKNVEPQNQTTAGCIYNITNNQTVNISFRLKVSRLIGSYPVFQLENFNDVGDWNVNNPSSNITNATLWNFTKNCMFFRNNPLNASDGFFSGQIVYFFNNTINDSYYNLSNTSQVFTKVNTYTCTSPISWVEYNFTTNYSNNNTYYNLSAYNITYITYSLDDSRVNITNLTLSGQYLTNHSIWIELIDNDGTSINSTEVIPFINNWSLLSLSLDQTNFNKANVSKFRVYFNSTKDESDDNNKFIVNIDDLRFNSTILEQKITISANLAYNVTTAKTLTTSYQSIGNISRVNITSTTGLLAFWFNYSNPTIGDRFNLNQLQYQLVELS